ncbi:hypothetical protein NPX13_g7401 [Xylaria arbuscula]|uniref:Uncharacterized protein n=1 Tax=Xylaria arbuscula TaxID=114810 RepID=A0A9W8NAK2_9PEZI|nr:hypothetical protein NPX13_g7401 [Xylaria arbuscula]
MFQLNLSRDIDVNADVALTEFDRWYKQNNISALLRARKSAREQRDIQQRQSQTISSVSSDTALLSHQNSRGGRTNRKNRGHGRIRGRQEKKDVLSEDIIKLESDEDGYDRHEYYPPTHVSYAWPSGSPYPAHANHYTANSTNHYHDYFEDDEDSSKYEPSELYSPFPPEGTPETIEGDTGALILKGVIYPGMAGFDSATEKDRRMRNQKKDPAVLLKLEANSQLVTRAEEVLDINLDHQRTRDVYDEPSIDGSGDENDLAANEGRTKRRPKAKTSSTLITRRGNARSRQHVQPGGKPRGARLSARNSRGASLSTISQSAIANRRVTRSSVNQQMPVHHHGLHPDVSSLCDESNDLDDEDFRTHVHNSVGRAVRRQQHERLPGLALRSGNPNAVLASPASTLKKSPPVYSGKENSHLLIKSPTSFSPYLHPSGDSVESNSYNPLCPQPRDGFGYPLYSSYDGDAKPSTPSGFNPINGSSAYDQAHIPNMTSNPYHRSQPGGDGYGL